LHIEQFSYNVRDYLRRLELFFNFDLFSVMYFMNWRFTLLCIMFCQVENSLFSCANSVSLDVSDD